MGYAENYRIHKKGFLLDNARLKEADDGGILKSFLPGSGICRSSEKVFRRKVLDIYATSIDYDPQAEPSKQLFKQVQNKQDALNNNP